MPFIFKINVSWKKGDLKSTNISNIFNIFLIFYRNVFALGFLYAILTENVGNNLKKNIGSCLGNPTTKNHFCHIRRAVPVCGWGAGEEDLQDSRHYKPGHQTHLPCHCRHP